MSILVSKLLGYLAHPMGLISLLVVFGLLFRLLGWARRAGFLMLLALVVLFLASSPKVAGFLASSLENQYPPVAIDRLPQTGIVVMLGGVLVAPQGPRLETELVGSSDRLLHTSRIFKQGKAARVYLSGGNVFDGYLPQSESVYAKQLLVEWGVPENNIDTGKNSRTTHQNALETRDYLAKKGWITKPVILVTSGLHMPRAVETFRFANIRIIPASTDILVTGRAAPAVFDWLPSAAAFSLTTLAVHEIVGIWYYRLRGWAPKSRAQ